VSEISSKDINKLAIPAIIAGISEPLIALADTSIIGHIGTNQLAGVGLASSLYLTMLWIIAVNLQRKTDKSVILIIQQGILFSALMGLGLASGAIFFADEIFTLYSAEGEIKQYAVDFFSIRAIGIPINLALLTIHGVFRGLQNTVWTMQITLIGGVINVILDLILVFGIDGFLPSFGVKGAAFASLIAQVVMFLIASFYLHKKCSIPFKVDFNFSPELIKLLKLGIDMVVRTASVNVAYYLANRYATSYGANYIASHTIAMNIWFLSAFFIDGYSNAAIAISGRLMGENDYGGLFLLGKKIIKSGVYLAIGLSIVYFLSYPFITHIFTKDADVANLFLSFFWMVIIIQPLNAVAFTLDGFFRGTNETYVLRNALLMATFLVFIPSLVISNALNFSIYGIWACFMLFIAFRASYLGNYFLKKYKKG
jgi:multidrug resistance protein, MATE family